MANIDLIREVKRSAVNHWGSVLSACGVDVPERGKHGACPVCGGTDRFHFIDDHHNGNWFCRQCDEPNHGDGLDLIAKVKGISILDAAKAVSQALSLPLPKPAGREAPKSAAPPIAEKVSKLVAQTTTGQSAYLTAKEHTCPVRLLDDGSMLLVIRRGDEVTGAQIIRPDGEKRLIAGTRKKGSFIPLSELPETVDTVLIAEGYATALSVAQLHDGLVLAAIDEGNLLPVAEWAAGRYPEAKIIIAADNDIKPGQPNVGKISAETAVKSFHRGWVTLPPTEDKADWDDYRQQHGTEAAKQAFSKGLYQVDSKPAVSRKKPRTENLTQMADNEKALLLAGRYDGIAVHQESEGFYVYQAGGWEKISHLELSREMGKVYGEHQTNFSKRAVNNVVDALKIIAPVMGEPCKSVIPFSNGVFDIETKLFTAHTPDNWLLNHNGIEYTPAKPDENLRDNAPHFHQWLDHAASHDPHKMKRIFAALYMVLANRYDWQLFLEITGEGGSGKSVFTQVATLLAGQHNTASGNMAALDSARGRAQYVGKSMITLPDQPKYTGEGTGIKAITGGDAVEIDPKHEQQYTSIIRAVVIATNNTPMIFTERAGGVARRRVIFQFNNKVKEEDKDPHLSEKIACEIPVIVRRLLANFDDPEHAKSLLTEQRDSDEALEVKRASNPVLDLCAALAFIGEPRGLEMGGGRKAEDDRQPRKYLYHLYLSFIEYQGLGRPLSVTEFGKAVKEAAKEYKSEYLTRTIKGRRQTNVQLTEKAEEFL
ncbi:toprim domain-containing protein [Morganella morganii]|uniref:toprim domain-containing protein n=3 Tax=Morganella morganii TaxID=582 RepID=UPI001BD95F94|nr:toprim domain-containing protein [Morganella morganii]MBT0412000.1 toprim domain-containing protein [Morganella morganii subsp. morganii]MBV0430645.1 toprim domain-containing protein [Morganella morganii subsp. morganii]HCT2374303.1 toprim domain-containing protein [Morganella morganii]